MNTHRRSLLLGLAGLALASCTAGPELPRIGDPGVDLQSYRTFAFTLNP